MCGQKYLGVDNQISFEYVSGDGKVLQNKLRVDPKTGWGLCRRRPFLAPACPRNRNEPSAVPRDDVRFRSGHRCRDHRDVHGHPAHHYYRLCNQERWRAKKAGEAFSLQREPIIPEYRMEVNMGSVEPVKRWPHSFGQFSEIFKWNVRGGRAANLIAGCVAKYASSGVRSSRLE
jgi:hypothetical protein